MTKTLSQSLSEFAVGFAGKDMPAEVREAARWHMIDAIGVCIAAPARAKTAARRR